MLRTLIFSAIIGGSALSSIPATASENMTAAMCQPLSRSNLESCCAAVQWRDLILRGEHRYCPRLSASDNDSGRLGAVLAGSGTAPAVGGGTDPVVGGGTDPVVGGGTDPVVGGGADPVVTGTIGNPGNDNPVGGAGEQDKANESPASGTKGNGN